MPAETEATSCGNNTGYHFAGQNTSHYLRLVQCTDPEFYYGWDGVDGQLHVPGNQITLHDYTTDHVVGFLAAQFPPSTAATWLQIGWFTGTVADTISNCTSPPPLLEHCIRRNGSFGWYAERLSAGGPTDTRYKTTDYGLAAVGALTTSRVVYSASSGCWESFLAYSGQKRLTACFEPTSGAMLASAEMNSAFGSPYSVDLPITLFGSSNPNTNEALRLHGVNGWEPWDTTLTAWYTESRDERYSNPRYVKSDFNSVYYFEAYRDP